MSDFNYIFLSLKSRLSNTLLTILLTAFGVSIGIILIQFENHINDRLEKDGKGIDIVVGAKGSPLQIVLSSIYHIDIPTGNIPYETVNKLSNDPQIKKIIPLALGDNWKGFRIVGTNYDYLKHYRSEIKEGRKWNKKFEAVAGASVDTELYDTFLGSHGLTENDNTHNHHKYKVVGILAKTGTVIDRLLLTSLNSVMDIHNLKNIDENLDHNNSQNHDDKIQKKVKKLNFTTITDIKIQKKMNIIEIMKIIIMKIIIMEKKK